LDAGELYDLVDERVRPLRQLYCLSQLGRIHLGVASPKRVRLRVHLGPPPAAALSTESVLGGPEPGLALRRLWPVVRWVAGRKRVAVLVD
jgi:hypothetical protein